MNNAKGNEQIFTNGRIATRDAEFDGTVVARDSLIIQVARGRYRHLAARGCGSPRSTRLRLSASMTAARSCGATAREWFESC